MSRTPPFHPDAELCRRVAAEFGTPVYLYDEATLLSLVDELLAFPAPFGLTARYAVKANPCAAILRLFLGAGLGFDASTTFEAERVIAAGVPPAEVQITAQVLPEGFQDLVRAGVLVTACSLTQLESCGRAFPGTDVGLRVNPGEGSGANQRTSVAGPNASFGVWHGKLDEALAIATSHGLRITVVHHHVGTGGEPAKWAAIAATTLGLVERLPDVVAVNLGGGFKVARMEGERETDVDEAGREIRRLLLDFAARTGRELRLELELGTFLTANAGAVVATVQEVVDTLHDGGGHRFVKLDTGMAEVLRPSLYGSQHPVVFHPAAADGALGAPTPLLVVGPCCESGDLLTPAPGDPEGLAPRRLPLPAPGDLAMVGGAGAYCSSMAARNYNSIPAAPEVLRRRDGALDLVRRRQTLEDVVREES